jgi:hypothetical protein
MNGFSIYRVILNYCRGFLFIGHANPDNNLESVRICMGAVNEDFVKFS